MPKIITGVYDDMGKIRNAVDELVSDGVEREKIYVDEDNKKLLVTVAPETERTVTEILQRHEPTELR